MWNEVAPNTDIILQPQLCWEGGTPLSDKKTEVTLKLGGGTFAGRWEGEEGTEQEPHCIAGGFPARKRQILETLILEERSAEAPACAEPQVRGSQGP